MGKVGTLRDINQRDLDALLHAFTDVQIADLYGVPVREVAAIRQRRNRPEERPPDEPESDIEPDMLKNKQQKED
jgi:hypothetical protein